MTRHCTQICIRSNLAFATLANLARRKLTFNTVFVQTAYCIFFTVFLLEDHEADQAFCVLERTTHQAVKLLQLRHGRGRGHKLVTFQIHLAFVHCHLQLLEVLVELLLQVFLLHCHFALILHDELQLYFLHVFFSVFKLDLHLLLLVTLSLALQSLFEVAGDLRDLVLGFRYLCFFL